MKLSIRNAAKAIHRSRPFVKGLVEQGKLRAWRAGGTAKHPRLQVDLEELKTVVERETLYVPQGLNRSDVARNRARRSSASSLGLDPCVANL